MEWRRAKTILILTFLVLNVLLGYQLWVNTNLADNVFERAQLREETLDKLRSKGIELNAEVPGETPKLQEITVHFAPSDIRTEPQTLNRSIEVEDVTKKRVIKKIAEQIPDFESYAFDPVLSGESELVYHQLYEGWPMFEVDLRLLHDGKKLNAYTMKYASVEDHTEEEEQPVLSAYKAISVLADNVLDDGHVIAHIQLGYHGQVYSSSTQVLAPKWRVALENGEIYYVHAMSGAIEKKE